jgi:GT2 family glycosyltransferase
LLARLAMSECNTAAMGNPEILIITVNFRQNECTCRFLESAARLNEFKQCHLLVVDNSSNDESVCSIRCASAGLNNVEILALPNNGGYFGAAKWVLQRYLRQHNLPQWVVVCNNDIVFDDPRFLIQLVNRDSATAGVIAPSITSAITGLDENPSIRVRPSPFRMWRYRVWLSNFYLMWFKQWISPFVRRIKYRFRNWTGARGDGRPSEIYAPSGAFLILSRRFFEAGGFIDDGAFLYAEEFRIAEMCRHLQLPVIHDPELRVWHAGSQSTGRMLTRKVFLHQKAGFAYALSKYAASYPDLQPMPQPSSTLFPNVAHTPAGESAR